MEKERAGFIIGEMVNGIAGEMTESRRGYKALVGRIIQGQLIVHVLSNWDYVVCCL